MSILKNYAEELKPLNKALSKYNEFWFSQYFDYNPTSFRISSYGGGSYFKEWETDQDKKQDGYIPMLSISTHETCGYTLIELNNKNAQKLYNEQPNVYEWLEYLLRRVSQENWEGFGWGDDKEYCHGISSETLTGVHNGTYAEGKSPNKLILCFKTGGGEAYDQELFHVIRVKEYYQEELGLVADDDGYVREFISEYCSPTLWV